MSPHICGPVQVNWNQDGTVSLITYSQLELKKAIEPLMRFQIVGGRAVIDQGLVSLIRNLLDTVAAIPSNDQKRKILLADKIFEHLNIAFNPPNPKMEALFQNGIIQQVWTWEDAHEKIHKGTPYFLMVDKYLSLGDIPSAYICMFNALEEDKRTKPLIQQNFKDAPAYCTTSLADRKDNYLYYSVVVPLRDYLTTLLGAYNTRLRSNLVISELDQKFLQNDALEDIKRFFVATIHELYHLSPLNSSRMINNDYSKLKVIDTLFNLGLIVDQILEYRFSSLMGKKDMANAVYQLALNLKWTTSANSRNPGEFIQKIQPNPNTSTPDQFLSCLLRGTATYNRNPLKDTKMKAILATYHLRNYGGHHLEGSSILINSYLDILDMVIDAFFTSIEML